MGCEIHLSCKNIALFAHMLGSCDQYGNASQEFEKHAGYAYNNNNNSSYKAHNTAIASLCAGKEEY